SGSASAGVVIARISIPCPPGLTMHPRCRSCFARERAQASITTWTVRRRQATKSSEPLPATSWTVSTAAASATGPRGDCGGGLATGSFDADGQARSGSGRHRERDGLPELNGSLATALLESDRTPGYLPALMMQPLALLL